MQHITLWHDDMETGITPLDDLHHSLFEAMSAAASANDEQFAEDYSALLKRMKCALLKEEQWMEEIDATLLKIYREQHARVLSALDNVHRRVLDKDFDLGRKVVADLLPQWYAVHVSTLDMALAIAIQANNIQITNTTVESSEMYID